MVSGGYPSRGATHNRPASGMIVGPRSPSGAFVSADEITSDKGAAPSDSGRSSGGPTPQARNNLANWSTGRYLSTYANRRLKPPEVMLLLRYRSELDGRLLDLGCGAGRLLAYLAMLGGEVVGLDLAERMVEYSRATVPGATVVHGDVGSLETSLDGRFDVVFAVDNLLDIYGDTERRRVLHSIHEILVPGGLLVFSAHNLAWVERHGELMRKRVTGARLRRLAQLSAADVAQRLRSSRRVAANRARLGPLQERHDGYAILNNAAHDYSLLHYHLGRDDQERQLADTGFELLECLDDDARPVGPGGTDSAYTLHYAARRAGESVQSD